MKIYLLKDVKIQGALQKKGALVDVPEDFAHSLIAGSLAECPRKSKPVSADPAPAAVDGSETEKPAPRKGARKAEK